MNGSNLHHTSPPPDHDSWQPLTPETVRDALRNLPTPWSIVGGYAIDLFLGRETRPHGDIEIAILREDFPTIREALRPLIAYTAGDGVVNQLEENQIPPDSIHQCWMLDHTSGHWKIDVMLEPGDPETWVYRRDRRIRAPRTSMIGTQNGIPYLLPHGVLLFKAKARREKDEQDFEAVLSTMQPDERQLLARWLQARHPDSPWIDRLR